MHTTRIAECILEQFLDHATASATVGDLLELTGARAGRRFWSQTGQIALTLFWRDVSAQPLFLLWIAFAGMCCQLELFALITIPLSTVLPLYLLSPTVKFFLIVVVFASFYLAGLWTSRRARSRMLAACAGIVALREFAIPLIWQLIVSITHARVSVPDHGLPVHLINLLGYAFLFAAAIRTRRASLNSPA